MSGRELLARWLASKPSEAKRKEAEAVLEAMGCKIRNSGENHLIAFHPRLVGHPLFRNGMLTVNCHYQGKQGSVHPAAITDIVKAAKHLRFK